LISSNIKAENENLTKTTNLQCIKHQKVLPQVKAVVVFHELLWRYFESATVALNKIF
jgi:hypothetical protein